MPAEMPVAPTTTQMPADMPVATPTYAEPPTVSEMPVVTPTEGEEDDSSSADSSSDDGDGSTTTTSETSYLPSSGIGVDSEDVPEDMPGAWKHLGCFKDCKEDRVLTRSKLGSPEMTADVSGSYAPFFGSFLPCRAVCGVPTSRSFLVLNNQSLCADDVFVVLLLEGYRRCIVHTLAGCGLVFRPKQPHVLCERMSRAALCVPCRCAFAPLLQVCFEYCSMRGVAYMALQFGYECWCSRNGVLEYERHGDGAVCDYPCLGDEVSQGIQCNDYPCSQSTVGATSCVLRCYVPQLEHRQGMRRSTAVARSPLAMEVAGLVVSRRGVVLISFAWHGLHLGGSMHFAAASKT